MYYLEEPSDRQALLLFFLPEARYLWQGLSYVIGIHQYEEKRLEVLKAVGFYIWLGTRVEVFVSLVLALRRYQLLSVLPPTAIVFLPGFHL